ncbi:glycerophosphodiester phosphodiesterase family protein [Streptomyces sp. ODS28]|uniref:glycerophosphodiester phosphodiesterase n=1 Tax=Streptomyces sp. ODS28 TaxID=3136688 RepID=UPI0031E6BADF
MPIALTRALRVTGHRSTLAAALPMPLMLSLMLLAGPQQHVPSPSAAYPYASRGRVTYTAHRGGSLEVPENSMSGWTAAYRRGTAQLLDADLRVLRDGTLVVMHDPTLDRTTNAHGPVDRLTLEQWRTVLLTPSRKLPGHWRPEHPPTLGQILRRFGGRTAMVLEIKDPRGLPRLSAALHGHRLTDSVYVQSRSVRVAARAHRMGLLSSVWRGPSKIRRSHPERWVGRVDMLSVDYRARARDVRKAVRSGIPHVWSHTVDTRAARDRMLRLGVTGIITDAPGRLTR